MLHREQPIRHSAYKTPHARHMYIQRVRQNTCALFSLCLYNDITLCLFSPQLHAMACSVHARQLSLACDSTSHIYKTAKLREALQALYNEFSLLDCDPLRTRPVQRHHSVSILATTACHGLQCPCKTAKLSLRFHKPHIQDS